jgi:hypothetical protein
MATAYFVSGRSPSDERGTSVIDSPTMSYWHKLFLVVLLALSLPVQSYAAVSMKCVAALSEAGKGATSQGEPHGMSAHAHEMHRAAFESGEHLAHGSPQSHLHACSTCASCCVGAGLLAVPVVATPRVDTLVMTLVPPSARVASFLTGGIERPPRAFLV